jgi:hypothetical protein
MKIIKNLSAKTSLSALALVMASSPLMAQELSITLSNLTHGLHFTPVITAAHNDDTSLFKTGMAATPQLQMMAEGGAISELSTLLTEASADLNENPAEGLIAPGMSTTYTLSTDSANTKLSLAAMILPSNDGFVGLSDWKIPEEAGTYTVFLNAYDAGTEANDEIVNGGGAPGTPGIPVAPGGDAGSAGSGVTDTESNTVIHIHRGTIGDDNATGGRSDLNSSIHRWLNPVAKLTITVQ